MTANYSTTRSQPCERLRFEADPIRLENVEPRSDGVQFFERQVKPRKLKWVFVCSLVGKITRAVVIAKEKEKNRDSNRKM